MWAWRICDVKTKWKNRRKFFFELIENDVSQSNNERRENKWESFARFSYTFKGKSERNVCIWEYLCIRPCFERLNWIWIKAPFVVFEPVPNERTDLSCWIGSVECGRAFNFISKYNKYKRTYYVIIFRKFHRLKQKKKEKKRKRILCLKVKWKKRHSNYIVNEK